MLNPVDLSAGDLFDAGGAQLTDHHAEEQFLGFLLNKPQAISDTIDLLTPVDLHDPMHRRIYELLLKAHESDTPITMEALTAGLGGGKAAGGLIAQIMVAADLAGDVTDTADHLSTIAERRAVGTVEDDYIEGAPIVSKFGGQRWENIGAGSGTTGYSWLVEDIIPLGEITLVFGDSGSGKSFNMFDMGMCVARPGLQFNGRNVEHGLVVYVAAEAGKGFAKRKIAYAIQHKLDPADPLPFYLCTKRPDFFHDDVDVVALIEEIKAVVRSYKVPLVLIVIDTLSALAPGMNENASQDVSMVRKRLVMLQDAFNASVVLVHHKPKGGGSPRGHGSLTADFETTIEFETVTDRHRATVKKQREGKSGMAWEFTLPVVEVGRNKWGNPETSCVVHPNISPRKQAVGFHATSTELLLLRALYDALADHPSPPPAGLPASITKVVMQRHVRVLMRERYIAPDEESSAADGRFRTAFSRAAAKLRDGAVLGVQGEWLWPTGKAVLGFNETPIDV